jgi:hypothetical protein
LIAGHVSIIKEANCLVMQGILSHRGGIIMRLSARQKRLLGVVLGERSMLVAEASCDRRVPTPSRVAEFSFPNSLTLDQPAELGAAFADFLAQNNFSATAAILGVPARRLVCRTVDLPPTDPRTAARMLWLQTLAHASEELGPMVFDYAGESNRDHPTAVNLIGLQRTYLTQILAFADAARLKPIAIAPTIIALAEATRSHAPDAICLSIRTDGAELAIEDASDVQLLKHIASTPALPKLIAELKRNTISTASTPPNSIRRRLVLWDDPALDHQSGESISQALGIPLIRGDVRWLEHAPATPTSAAPLALIWAAHNKKRLTPNFRASRIKPLANRRLSRPAAAICAALAAMLIVALAGYTDLLHIQHEIDSSRDQLAQLQPQLEIARPFASQMQFVKTFQPGRSNYLQCLKDLTLSIPQDSKTYLTGFTLKASMKGTCVGHSNSDQDVLDLLDKLSATGRFSSLNRQLDAHSKGNLADVLFTINFTYVPAG